MLFETQRYGQGIHVTETIQRGEERNQNVPVFHLLIFYLRHKYGRVLTANESHFRIVSVCSDQKLFFEAGLSTHELKPPVTVLKYFVPDKKTVMLEHGKVPDQYNINKQIENTEYMKWFERNKLEHEIFCKVEHLKSQPGVDLFKLKDETNKELGYVKHCLKTL